MATSTSLHSAANDLITIGRQAYNANGGKQAASDIDLKGLKRDLSKKIQGEVRFDRGSIGLYATDSSNFREIPLRVVVPKNTDDVVETHAICSRYGAPILSRGCGTSLSGETVNFAVVIDHSKYLTKIGSTDTVQRLVTVEPGAINEQVNRHTGKQNLVFGPDPSTHSYCNIGGNIGNNSCGIHSVQSQIYGPGPRTSDNVHSMEIVTYRGERFQVGVGEESETDRIIRQGGRKGEIYRQLRRLRDRYAHLIRERYRPVTELPRRVSGYNLDELLPERGFNVARALVGTEGTCVTALNVTLMLTPALLKRVTVVVQYEELPDAAEHVPEILDWKPIALEALDHQLFEDEQLEHRHVQVLKKLPRSGKGSWLFLEFGSDSQAESQDTAKRFQEWLIRKKRYAPDRIALFGPREPGGPSDVIWKLRESGLGASAFPPNKKDHWPGWEDSAVPPDKVAPCIRDLKKLYEKYGYTGAMYGHLGQGCIHSRISFELRTTEGIRKYREFLGEASDLVVSYGGSLSGEHGDGQQRAEFLYKQYGSELVEAMREFKRIWDPDWKMNPNCVGAGKCREPHTVDVMCPSYAVTREEKHTTRGRARLLFEMMQGDVIHEGWQSKEVFEALDLCLACKGCTNDCPVHVDMPTYKSGFLYHHYKGLRRNRSRYAYAFGFIDFVTQTPGLSNIAKFVAGIDRRRKVPKFAPTTLQAWFHRRGGSVNKNGPRVVLWPDTFNNHFHTDVGSACVEALETAGFYVVMPEGHVCCGRPLYDYKFLDIAEKYLHRTIAVLRDEVRKGTPVVGMEPSCMAVFRDELTKMLPHDEDAMRLRKNCYHWAEFFEKHNVEVPKLDGKAIVWGHCHHKATGGLSPEMKMLKEQMGMEVEEAKGGCCGLAGSWGFETGKYDISMQCGEIGLLPAVRNADPSTLIIANGFSCKTQLEQSGVDRHALHTAEVMRIAGKLTVPRLHGEFPERMREPKPPAPTSVKVARAAAALGLSGLALLAAFMLSKGNHGFDSGEPDEQPGEWAEPT